MFGVTNKLSFKLDKSNNPIEENKSPIPSANEFKNVFNFQENPRNIEAGGASSRKGSEGQNNASYNEEDFEENGPYDIRRLRCEFLF
jgi:hypothetical protein